MTRNERRNEALAECVRQVTTGQGGCCTPFPFTAAIWLLEEQEELRGGIQPSSRASRVLLSQQDITFWRLLAGH